MIGTRIGPYEVLAKLGQGGMGEVYRAHDTKLHRDVAIKVLPDAVAGDRERRARFDREAQLLASLNHPHIGQIYGVEDAGSGGVALVMELVDGDTLDKVIQDNFAGRTSRSDLSWALSIAQQIASALEAAHERGIIHRDLKPGNVMVNRDGQVKVLDFGLGKAIDGDQSRDASNSPTMTIGATQAGMILGTAAYMAPEQAKGRVADKRSDVWSFGCVLYELLTGRRAFEGEDVSETLASVLKQPADFAQLPKDLPPPVRLVVERCLTKDRATRLADISTARFLLSEPGALGTGAPAAGPGGPRTFSLAATVAMVVGAVVLSSGAAIFMNGSRGADGVTPVHLSIRMPGAAALDNTTGQPVAVSPDGRTIVFAARSGGRTSLYARTFDKPDARLLVGTEDASYPFFSPNGEWVGFMAQDKLKKASLGGAAVETLASARSPRGAAWGDDGYIYFTLSNVGVIVRVRETGGDVTEVTRLDAAAGEISHRDPEVLPGSKALVFSAWKGPGPDEKVVAVKTLTDDTPHRILVRGGVDARYMPPGYLVYARGDNLLSVPFDASTLEVATTAPVALPVRVIGEATEGAAFAVSRSGVLAYIPAEPTRLTRRLVWLDERGQTEALRLPERAYEQVSIAPDGASAIAQIIDGSVGLWLVDLVRETVAPFVTTGGSSQAPVWTPDSKRVIYRATRTGTRNLYWKAVDGSGDEERLTTAPGMMHTPSSVSQDGWVIFTEVTPDTRPGNIRLQQRLRLGGTGESSSVGSNDEEHAGQVSPDGRWIAFEGGTSDDDAQIYVRAYPGPGPRVAVSRSGGVEPLWSRDGKKLFFRSQEGVQVVEVTASSTFAASLPRVLSNREFQYSSNSVTSYAQGRDGRLLFVESVNPGLPPDTINVVLNWGEELRRVVK